MTDAGTPWVATPPTVWPSAPATMTVSALVEMERCPRRWALAHAEYPKIWARRGYPRRPVLGTLGGLVVHSALETITEALSAAGVTARDDAGGVAVMRALGGYSRVIGSAIDGVLSMHRDNPRAAPHLENAKLALCAMVPTLRAQLQNLLALAPSHPRAPRARRARERSTTPRVALPPGAHAEIELRAEHLGWYGRVDLLVLSDVDCEIVDFKTGAHADWHEGQLRIYALLWVRDADLNPARRLPTKLTLAYVNGTSAVAAPTSDELDALERDLLKRTVDAQRAVASSPPPARPSIETCDHCSVRHLCDEYWGWLTESTRTDGHVDAEVLVTRRHGPKSWEATVTRGPRAVMGTRVMVREGSSGTEIPGPGALRVLAATLSQPPEDGGPAMLTLGSASEIYRVAD